MAQITSVTSESLQAKIRELLPSQQGFGEDLQASNVILPTIDLTAAAQGTTTGVNLQTALAFGSQTAFETTNSSVVIANTPGFWRVVGTGSIRAASGSSKNVSLDLSDGLSTKKAWNMFLTAQGGTIIHSEIIDLVFFLQAGDSLTAVAGSECQIAGSIRQIADVNGNLVNPVGFTPQ